MAHKIIFLPFHRRSGWSDQPQDETNASRPCHDPQTCFFISIIKGAPVLDVVQCLCQAQAQALKEVDVDGNLPVHHTACCSCPVLKFVIEAHPQACQVSNCKDQFPLHLLSASSICCLNSETAAHDLQLCFQAHPQAIQLADRYGRLPLHLTCQRTHSSTKHSCWDTVEFLIQEHPAALVTQDKLHHTPCSLLKNCSAAIGDGKFSSGVVAVDCLRSFVWSLFGFARSGISLALGLSNCMDNNANSWLSRAWIQGNPCVRKRINIRCLRPCHRAWVYKGFILSKVSLKCCI
jgi:hypothetical protein